jgi:hypothetical protein
MFSLEYDPLYDDLTVSSEAYQDLQTRLDYLSDAEMRKRSVSLPKTRIEKRYKTQKYNSPHWNHVRSLILGFLQTDTPTTLRQIGDYLLKEHGIFVIRSQIGQVCNCLIGQYIDKQRIGLQTAYLLRSVDNIKPEKVFSVGDPVVQFKGTRSEQNGQVIRFQYQRQKKRLMPVVEWSNGSTSFADEETLDIQL